jgi:hypothetical protein
VQEVLDKIRSSTEREILPFISASRYPQQREKEFVSHISENHVRVWKVPSSSRRRQNISVPYLSGEVVKTETGCIILGHFALHPFCRIYPLLPLAIAGPIWLSPDRSGHFLLIATAVTVISVLVVLILSGAVRQLQRQEESDILQFLSKLFPEVQIRLQ